jgi:hypothetical protein
MQKKRYYRYDTNKYCHILNIINFGIFNFQFILCIFNNYFDIQTGVGRLLNKEVYKAAYPLHDGEYSYTDFEKDDSRRTQNIRQVNQEKIKSTFVIYCAE